MRRHLLPVVVWLIALLSLWQLFSWYLLEIVQRPLAQSSLPYIHKVLHTFAAHSAALAGESSITFMNAALGFVVGAFVGIGLAVMMNASRLTEKIAFPYIVISQMIPVLALGPIIYGIVRDENLSRIIISGYVTFLPVCLNMLRGLKSVSPHAVELMHAHAASSWSTYWKLRLPAAIPGLFSGLKIAAPLSVTSAILVEMMGANRGIGVVMLRNLYYGPSHTYLFWSTVLAAAIVGLLNYQIVSLAERLVSPWQPAFRTKGGR